MCTIIMNKTMQIAIRLGWSLLLEVKRVYVNLVVKCLNFIGN